MKPIIEIIGVLLLLVGIFFAGRLTAPTSNPEIIIESDTIWVEKLVPEYITKYIEKDGKIDTQYIAKIDTVIKDVELNVSYESINPIPLGAFNITAITPSFRYNPTEYYVQTNAFAYLSEASVSYRLSVGRYLINKPNLKLGLGGFYERRNNVNYGGIEGNLRLEF